MSIIPTQANAQQQIQQPSTAGGSAFANVKQAAANQQARLQTAYKDPAHPDAATSIKEAAKQESKVKEATQQLNDFMKHFSIKLNFSVDSDSKQIVVKVLNQETGELIRQIPSEETLRLAKAMDTLQGLIIRTTV